MPETVAEAVAVSGVLDHPSCRGVDLAQRGARHQRPAAGPLRRAHDVVDVPLPHLRLPQHEGAGHVGVVAAHQRPEVDLDEVTGCQFGRGRTMVGHRRIGARGHDGLERGAVGAVVEHPAFQLPRDGSLGAAGAQAAAAHQIGQRRVGGLTCQSQQCHLAGVLDLPQSLHAAGGPDQFGTPGQLFGQCGETVDGDDVTFKPDPGRPAGDGPGHQMASAGTLDHQVQVRRLPRRLGAVPRIGGQHRRRAVGEYQDGGVGTGESGQITHVDQVTDQQRVQPVGGQESGQPHPALGMCHDPRRYSLR